MCTFQDGAQYTLNGASHYNSIICYVLKKKPGTESKDSKGKDKRVSIFFCIFLPLDGTGVGREIKIRASFAGRVRKHSAPSRKQRRNSHHFQETDEVDGSYPRGLPNLGI